MYPETLYPKTKQVLENIKSLPILQDFYLAGGTALALQLGHRKSVDLDFFSEHFPKSPLIIQQFQEFTPSVLLEAEGTIDMSINSVKLSFLKYDYPLLNEFSVFESVKLASVIDVACMKLTAISSRGSKKDFIDLYKILQTISIDELFNKFEQKYGNVNYQKSHILKSLLTFDLANEDPDPDYIEKFEWPNVKRSIEKDVKNYLDTLQINQ